MAKFCINCGKEMPDGASACPSCGTMVEGAVPAGTTVVVNNVQPQKKTNGLALAGFIVSLVSTLLCCGSFSMISLILSILGVVKAKDYGGNGKGLGIAGIIISAIGFILLFIFSFFYAIIAADTGYYGY